MAHLILEDQRDILRAQILADEDRLNALKTQEILLGIKIKIMTKGQGVLYPIVGPLEDFVEELLAGELAIPFKLKARVVGVAVKFPSDEDFPVDEFCKQLDFDNKDGDITEDYHVDFTKFVEKSGRNSVVKVIEFNG